MALPKITITKGKGGLQRPLPGEDHYSGLLFYKPSATDLPTGFGTDKIKQITSLADAENKGITSDSAGYKILHYHISEFFRINPQGVTYVMIDDEPVGSYDFANINDLQDITEGKLRQIGVYQNSAAFATAQVTALQALITTAIAANKPYEALYAGDFAAVADLSSLDDLRALTAENVSVVFGQDGGAIGKALFDSEGVSITCLGAALGAVSLAKVSESIAWVDKFNMLGTELDTLAFANGDLVSENLSSLETINTKGYLFLLKHFGIAGSYFNDTHTCVASTSDYAQIENNRVIHKAIRGVRTRLLPELNRPLLKSADGLLDISVQNYLEAKGGAAPGQMVKDGELSGYGISVDRDLTSGLDVTLELLGIDVARTINVKIGFTLSLS